MGDIAIQVNNLGKEYRIGVRQEAYRTLRDALSGALAAPFRRAGRLLRGESGGAADLEQRFWALKELSFDVHRGEVVGIIGRNGAGKSTLLKILSRITEPTTGSARIYGRVGSLLEVGTGFHSELTGRDNIYLNGAILGMRHAEIDRKFDEIVSFAEVEQFIDTPVKHYSSGMYLRLAFAVAAHLEPEILIVDEVLAVGDAAFQKKCLGKMGEVAHEGRTVLFVSHDMQAINTLCDRAILLHSGALAKDGLTREVVASYLESTNRRHTTSAPERQRAGADEISLLDVKILQGDQQVGVVNCRESFDIVIEYEIRKVARNMRFFILLRNEKNETIFGTSDYDEPAAAAVERKLGTFTSTVTIPGNIFKVGTIHGTIGADIERDRIIFMDENAFQIDIIEDGNDIVSGRHQRIGLIAPLLSWRITPSDAATERP
jgi:lipopolysaccharide transport system ATP-binding protein